MSAVPRSRCIISSTKQPAANTSAGSICQKVLCALKEYASTNTSESLTNSLGWKLPITGRLTQFFAP